MIWLGHITITPPHITVMLWRSNIITVFELWGGILLSKRRRPPNWARKEILVVQTVKVFDELVGVLYYSCLEIQFPLWAIAPDNDVDQCTRGFALFAWFCCKGFELLWFDKSKSVRWCRHLTHHTLLLIIGRFFFSLNLIYQVWTHHLGDFWLTVSTFCFS